MPVVEDLDPPGNGLAGRVAGLLFPQVAEIGLEFGPEGFGQRIVKTRSRAPHRLIDPQFLTHPIELVTGELSSPVRVEHQSFSNSTAQRVCHPQYPLHQVRGLGGIHRPAKDPTGATITDRAHLEPALTTTQIRDI